MNVNEFLVGGFKHDWIIFHICYMFHNNMGCHPSQSTKSYFSRWLKPPTRCQWMSWYESIISRDVTEHVTWPAATQELGKLRRENEALRSQSHLDLFSMGCTGKSIGHHVFHQVIVWVFHLETIHWHVLGGQALNPINLDDQKPFLSLENSSQALPNHLLI